MSEYRVHLDIFNGPVDLLLYLIRRNEVEIEDIPIATITEQFLEYVHLIKEMDLEEAGDFLVMAATLVEIKSALLLPRQEAEGEVEEEGVDPRLQLVRQLLEYKQFKDLAMHLDDSAQQQSQRFGRSLADLQRLRKQIKQENEMEMESLQLWDLFDAFSRILKATHLTKASHEVIHDETPIDVYQTEILYRAQQEKPLLFHGLFQGCKHRGEMVGLFLALLELIRLKLVRFEQEKIFGPIYLFAQTDLAPEEAVAKAISRDISSLPSKIHMDQNQKE